MVPVRVREGEEFFGVLRLAGVDFEMIVDLHDGSEPLDDAVCFPVSHD
jgi:hypothetical protein